MPRRRPAPPARAGFTLVEVLLVMAILIIVGAILAPSFMAMSGDTKVKAAGDAIRARATEARGAAIGENRAYKLAISSDGLRIRVAPDDMGFGFGADEDSDGPLVVEDDLPKGVIATPLFDAEAPVAADDAGWVRVATFNPDGTCRDDLAVIEVREQGVAAVWVRIRGLTGGATVGPVLTKQGGTP